jgi:NADH-quinone oxidoreductase subunit E
MDYGVREINDILSRHGHDHDGSLLAILSEVQDRFHFVPPEALILVSQRLGVPLSQAYSVATFYHAFSLTPRGRHLVHVCTGTACHVRGAAQVLDRLKTVLGIPPGETTQDRQFTLETVNCLGACALGPVVVLDGEYSGQMTAQRVDRLLKRVERAGG